MLTRTFVHLPGIGHTTERAIWGSGIRSWSDALSASVDHERRRLLKRMREGVELSDAALADRNSGFFSRLESMGEAWRLYREFDDECVFLDIETTGLSSVFDLVTVVGLYDGRDYRTFVRGQNLSELPDVLARYKIVVTFNGAQFDLRFLRLTFSRMALPPVHIDLRWVTARLGLTGGLKKIEERIASCARGR